MGGEQASIQFSDWQEWLQESESLSEEGLRKQIWGKEEKHGWEIWNEMIQRKEILGERQRKAERNKKSVCKEKEMN